MNAKYYEKALNKAKIELQKETNKQVDIFYCSAGVVLWRSGWRMKRIKRRFNTSMQAWTECGDYGPTKSMLEMMEEETGIELKLDGAKSYHEYTFLDGSKWDGKPLPYPKLIAVKQAQKAWIGLMIFACLCLSLHRDDKFGFERISKFVADVDAIRRELGDKDVTKYLNLFKEETGHDFHELSRNVNTEY